ncbi:hypothetical protein JCM21900_002606 [Sporobolomyces salmonicolor]
MILRTGWSLALALLPLTEAFYLPGSAPNSYKEGDEVPLLVNSLSPGHNVQYSGGGLVSYDAYDERLGFCRPDSLHAQSLSLGSALFGDRLYNSAFDIRMLRNTTCQTLCRTTLSKDQSSFLAGVMPLLAHDWLVDGLPAAEMRQDKATGDIFYSPGFPIGESRTRTPEAGPDKVIEATENRLNNHFQIILEYHSRPKEGVNRVVGAVVWPTSVDSLAGGGGVPNCHAKEPYLLHEGEENEVAYTYDVIWRESATPWATRWDLYLRVFSPRIHVLSLINSIVVALFLCLMVWMVLIRVLNRDISRYNALSSVDLDLDPGVDSVQEDYGWKLVHGEVFRSPKHRMWLCVVVGSGAQMTAMIGVTLVFALLGFLSPSNRGGLSTVMIVCWTLFGFIAGYVSSRLYLTLKGEDLRKNMVYTAVLFPTALFAFLFLLNLFLIGAHSSGAVPFGTFMAIACLWFGINVPLTVVGGWLGVKRGPIENPVRVNQIPRQIPPSEWWLKPLPSALLAGVLPFGAGFIETYFVMQSLFGSKAYYAFGFLALSSIVVALTTALTSVLMAYFHLCAEDYRWHWRAFLAGGGSAFYLFFYGILYWATKLHLAGFTNKVLYLGYLLVIAGVDFLVTGTIGFLSVALFLRVIYSRIRVD